MKANKENCRSSLDYPRTGECSLRMVMSEYDPKIRVIEVPKYWREYGKQYKVSHFLFENARVNEKLVIKAPRGCTVSKVWSHPTVEYYD